MGILKTLLTGGAIFGQVCQTISGALTHQINTGNGRICYVRASKAEINGVRFTEVADEGGEIKLCAFNTDVDMYACVTYPDGYGKTEGAQIFIPPMETMELPIGDFESASPDMPFYVQKIDLSKGAAVENNRVILAFKQLRLDSTVLEVYNTKLTAALNKLEVFFPTAGLADILSAEFISENGVHAILREPIKHIDKEFATTSYSIRFDILGFIETDVLGGTIQFGITTENAAKLKAAADQAASASGLKEVSRLMCSICGIEKRESGE